MLASVVEIEMLPPSPLPATIPEGATALRGKWTLRGKAFLQDFAVSRVGYQGKWQRRGDSVDSFIIMEPGEIDWLEEGSAPAERRSTAEPMSNDSPDPELEALDSIRSSIASIKGWPLDKSETFAAFALMGLTSRLQPLQVNSTEHQELVVDLARKLGEMAAK